RHAVLFFFSNAPPPTPTYALSLHDALPIYGAAGGEHRAGGAAAREDAALGDDGVLGDAAAAVGVALAEHELRGRQVPVDGPQGPLGVVEVEGRAYRAHVHVRLVEGVERPDVAPVAGRLLRFAAHLVGLEVVHVDRVVVVDGGQDVAAEVVLRVLELAVR